MNAGALAAHLRLLSAVTRRTVAFAVLTLTGIWRAAALALDGLLDGLAREWRERARATVAGPAWAAGLSAGPARLLAALASRTRRLTRAHARWALRADRWPLPFVG